MLTFLQLKKDPYKQYLNLKVYITPNRNTQL